MIKNIMEEIVWSYLPEIVAQYPELCRCPDCAADIVALSLNNLAPKYVASDSGELYSKVMELEQQFRTAVYVELAKASEKVLANPRHARGHENFGS